MRLLLFKPSEEFKDALEIFASVFELPYQIIEFEDPKTIENYDESVIIVCNDHPEKLTGIHNLQKVRSVPELSGTPLLLLSEKLSDHAKILLQDIEIVYRSELPFHSGHFFVTLDKINNFITSKTKLLANIRKLHIDIAGKRFKEAFQLLNIIAKDYPDQFNLNLIYGRLYKEANDFDKALHFTNRALSLSPQSLQANNVLASIYFKQGDKENYEKTIEQMKKIGEILLQNSIHWGGIYLEKGQSQKSISTYEQALAKDPENIEVKQGLVAAHLIDGRTSIVENSDFAESQSMELARLFNLKGISMAEGGNYPAAERLYKNAINLLPYENLEHKLWLNLGLCMKKKGNLNRASEYFQKSNESAPPEYNRASAQLKAIEVHLLTEKEKSLNFGAELRVSKQGDTLNYANLQADQKRRKKIS